MAAGINQASTGATITFQDNTHADADLDGAYGGENDIYALDDVTRKALASGDWIDSGSPYRVIRSKASLEHGTATSGDTAATTFRDKNACLAFDAGKTMLWSTYGQADRVTELGQKALGPNGKPAGKNGVYIVTGAAITIHGTLKMYGSVFRNNAASGAIAIGPGATCPNGEIIDSAIENPGSGNIAIGVSGYGVPYISGLRVVLGTGALSAVISDYVEQLKVVGSGLYLVNSTFAIRAAGVTFEGSPTTADVHATAYAHQYADTIWSDNCVPVDMAVGGVEDWAQYVPSACDGSSPVAGCPVCLLDKNGNNVTGIVYSDAEGNYTHGTPEDVMVDRVRVRYALGGFGSVVWYEDGPFTERVNMDGTTLPGYAGQERTFNWPFKQGTYARQLQAVRPRIVLGPYVAPPVVEVLGTATALAVSTASATPRILIAGATAAASGQVAVEARGTKLGGPVPIKASDRSRYWRMRVGGAYEQAGIPAPFDIMGADESEK